MGERLKAAIQQWRQRRQRRKRRRRENSGHGIGAAARATRLDAERRWEERAPEPPGPAAGRVLAGAGVLDLTAPNH